MNVILPIVSGLLAYVVFPPVNWYPLAFIFLAPFFVFIIREKSFWKLALGTIFFRFAYGLALAPYIFDSTLYAQSIAVFLGFAIAVYFFKKIGFREEINLTAIGTFYLIFDFLQSRYTLIPAYPINLGVALGLSPFVGLAKLGGLPVLSAFLVITNILAAAAWQKLSPKKILTTLTAVILAATIASPLLPRSVEGNREFKFASISTDFSFDDESAGHRQQMNKISESLGVGRYDLVIFPESLFNLEISESDKSSLEPHSALAKELKTKILANVVFKKADGDYNANLLIDEKGEIIGEYDKTDLIYGTEYWPEWAKLYGKTGMFNRGQLPPVMSLGNDLKIASPICFESHRPGRMREFADSGADIIINSSSNKWIRGFGSRGLDRYLGETLALRRIYSVWLGKPIIISGRGDYAGVITPDGEYEVLDFQNAERYTIYKGTIKYNY